MVILKDDLRTFQGSYFPVFSADNLLAGVPSLMTRLSSREFGLFQLDSAGFTHQSLL